MCVGFVKFRRSLVKLLKQEIINIFVCLSSLCDRSMFYTSLVRLAFLHISPSLEIPTMYLAIV